VRAAVKYLRYLLVLVWGLAVLAAIWGVLEAGSLSRRSRAVGRQIVAARAAGLDLSALQAQQTLLSEGMDRARTAAVAGAAVTLLLPLGWGIRKGLGGRRPSAAEEPE
jgi:hypothetical protein